VFIGIESPNEDSLKETKKLQNVRPRAGTLLERVHKVQQHGLDVWCGMIVGFDHDETSIFEVMPKFLDDAHIGNALVGMLYAIPTTPLYDRLKAVGRLNDSEDSALFGTNVVPLGMQREELRQGFSQVMRSLYAPDAYFKRIDALFLDSGFKFAVHQLPYWRTHRWAWMKRLAGNYVKFLVLSARLLRRTEDEGLRARYRAQLKRIVRTRLSEPHILFIYAIKIAMHYHYASIVAALGGADDKMRALPDGLRSFSRAEVQREASVAASP
jgi:radical SAM superfamily enzyme YgiQ (UPF0313 family)